MPAELDGRADIKEVKKEGLSSTERKELAQLRARCQAIKRRRANGLLHTDRPIRRSADEVRADPYGAHSGGSARVLPDPPVTESGEVGRTSTPAVDRDLVAEAPRTVGRADEIDLRQRGRPFLLRLPESADGGNP